MTRWFAHRDPLGATAPRNSASRQRDPAQLAVAPPTNDDIQIEQRLRTLIQPALATLAQDSQLRVLVRNIVSRQFDGDTNALFSTVIQEAEEAWLVDPYDPNWMALKDAVAQFQYINGWTYYPQIYINDYDEGVIETEQIIVAVAPADENAVTATGYAINSGGYAEPVMTVDEAYMSVYEVWVLSVNEPVPGTDPRVLAAASKAPKVSGPTAAEEESAQSTSDMRIAAVCNPTGIRNDKGLEYLQKWRAKSESSFGQPFEGKREMRLQILNMSGAVIKNIIFPKVKKKRMDEWQNADMFITTWDRAVWGDVFGYVWSEIDSGPNVSIAINIPIPAPIGGSITTTLSWQARDDDGGSTPVMFTESTYIQYDTGLMLFNVCSMGGDGGTGNDNLACAGVASASSTFSGYSPARANDCNRDTRLGGLYSWANNSGTYPPNNPEWIQVDFGVNKTFRRFVVYTSAGYPIRDFDIQVWNGVNFVTVASVTGNTQLSMTITLTSARTSRLVRLLGRHGPTHQPGYVRVNEIEVYPV